MMAKANLPTLDDVASLSGVSTATVSRCLNNPDKVSAKTRARILQAIDQIGYTPNIGGRMLASNRSNMIGVIIPTMENAIFARGIQALQEELAKAGFTILVASSNYDPEQEFNQLRTLITQGADAVFLIGINHTQKTYDFLESRNIPFVLAWNYQQDYLYPTVGFDNQAAAAAITHEIITLGHRHLAMISAPTYGNDRALARVNGVKTAMQDKGLDPQDLTLIHTHYALNLGADAFEDIMQRAPNTTAVICGNDVLAVGAISKAQQMGISIPQHVSITGFDNIDLAAVANPKLTTIHVPHRRMGQQAAILLLDLLKGQDVQKNIKIDFDLIKRESLAPPQAKIS
ncbi:MAG: LacI family DNA-binding transcriptional regulator [Alphaproteobacteria bacterium]